MDRIAGPAARGNPLASTRLLKIPSKIKEN